MNAFRNFFKSKIGLAITLGFLALIAFAFASSDVANTGTFGGVAGGDRVAVVGDEKISTSELSRAASNAVDRLRGENPTLSMQAFIAQDGLEQVIDGLIDRYAISAYAERHGLMIGTNLINSEIRQIPTFFGADGEFNSESYNAALRAQGLNDAMMRQDITSGLHARIMLSPVGMGAAMPNSVARRYAALIRERRIGAIGMMPSAAFAPQDDPTDEQLQAFYRESRADFIRPERRVIRYLSFGTEAVSDRIEPTDAEIAARYERDSEEYAASEARTLTQLIVPTQAAAASFRERAQAGASLDQLAREAGLRTSTLGPVQRSEVRSQASAAVAQAYFAADRGSLTQPARSASGWHIARVDAVETRPERSLASVRDEIADTVREEKRVRALANFAAELEEEIDGGATLTDLAGQYDLELQTTRPVLANGMIYETQNERVAEELNPALQTAFQMDESEPQVAEVARGETYLAFEVTRIAESAAAPLAEIRDAAIARWKLSEGSKRARAAADRVMKRVAGGSTLAAAFAEEEVQLPAPQRINQSREDLARQQERVPAPLALFFSMAQGSTKKLAAPRDIGWFVVDLDEIEVGTIEEDDPLVEQARADLGPAVGGEYVDQLVAAMRNRVGVERNDDAIEAVRKQLTGER